MKIYLVALAVTTLVLNSCASNNDELSQLKKENAKLKKQLTEYDNALVITPENAQKYLGCVAFSFPTAKTNEEITYTTCLTLREVPSDFNVTWTANPEPMSFDEDGTMKSGTNVFEQPRKLVNEGSYTLTFPNGKTWSIPWEKEYEIK